MKESEVSTEKILYNMVLHNNLYGADTRFTTILGPAATYPIEK